MFPLLAVRVLRAPVAIACVLSSLLLSNPAWSYYAAGGKIYDGSGQEIVVHGISHFGFNNPILQPQYLWAMGWKEQIAQIKALGFNAVRLLLAPDVLYVTTPVDQLCYVDPNKNADLLGKTPLQVLDLWMAEADRQGLYVMLNMYSVSKQQQYPTWFVSNPADYSLTYKQGPYTRDDWIHDLTSLAQRYAGLPHFFAFDLYNEPNGSARWSTGTDVADSAYFWKPAVEAAATSVLGANPALLIFVEGVAHNYDGIEDSILPTNWGEDLQPQAYQPLAIASDKLVLSPHSYGPDVYMKSTFQSPLFPSNLATDWDKLFGNFFPAYTVIPGEWGGNDGQGPSGSLDVTWENAFVDYLVSRGLFSTFWWCYTPNSLGTGGILDDNLQVRQDKMDLLKRLWNSAPGPAPSPSPTPAPAPTPTPAPSSPPPNTSPPAPGSGTAQSQPSQRESGAFGPELLVLLASALGRRRKTQVVSTTLPVLRRSSM